MTTDFATIEARVIAHENTTKVAKIVLNKAGYRAFKAQIFAMMYGPDSPLKSIKIVVDDSVTETQYFNKNGDRLTF